MQLFTKKYNRPGTKPGTIEVSGFGKFTLSIYDYNKAYCDVINEVELDQCKAFIERNSYTWIHVQGEPSKEAMKLFAKNFGIHELY